MTTKFDEWESSLAHYGIPGMRKGVRREELREQYLEKLRQMRGSNGAVQAVTGEGNAERIRRRREFILQRRKDRMEAARREPTEEEIEEMRAKAQSEAIDKARVEGQKRGAENAAKAAAAAAASKGGTAQQGDPKKRRGGSSNMTVARR